ncbi:hypothetical protein IMCC3317_42360 [Kordia antarctica]|uniref:Uncharacterized protein n=1 Tax=Kordia antarctica TaxID=1218801 RepID=A0A7L4ZRK2_9FLAO|nr:hypothetical protein [Kordia antarctica]QHI38836.1 hypothetical protein IMCC3317_42360 [Kordia antarctica]
MKTRFYLVYLSALALLLVTSCVSLRSSVFDQYSYQKGTEIKVDATRLMDKADQQYDSLTAAIVNLETELEKMVEYEKNKPDNQISYAMWKMIADPNKKFIGGFLKLWKEKGAMSTFFATEAKGQVVEALDLILQYEGKKDPAAENKLKAILGLQ